VLELDEDAGARGERAGHVDARVLGDREPAAWARAGTEIGVLEELAAGPHRHRVADAVGPAPRQRRPHRPRRLEAVHVELLAEGVETRDRDVAGAAREVEAAREGREGVRGRHDRERDERRYHHRPRPPHEARSYTADASKSRSAPRCSMSEGRRAPTG